MDGLTYRARFGKIGWTSNRDSNEILLFQNLQIEAIQVICNNVDVQISVWNKEGRLSGDTEGVAGTTGKNRPLWGIAVECERKGYIFYRVFRKKGGWSTFVSDGEIAGTEMGDDAICGVQLFLRKTEETYEQQIRYADNRLMEYEHIRNNLFIDNMELMLLHLTKEYKGAKAQVRNYENAYILPLKVTENIKVRNACYSGGVIDERMNFVAGHERKNGKNINLSCIEGYYPENALWSDETVIYGGILYGVFGHTLTESLSRFWYIIDHPECNVKIAMLVEPGTGEPLLKFFELMGIDVERIMFIDRPIQFRNVIVPDQGIRLHTDYKESYKMIYQKIASNCPNSPYKKIYLTRTHLKNCDGINEEYFENFFMSRGYRIIAPEEHSLEEQISYLKCAEDVICTMGTLSHLAIFCKPSTNFTIIRRCDKSLLLPQTLINQASGINFFYVDATYNILPTQHAGGTFLYGPTENFRNYLIARKINFSEKELEFDIKLYTYEYIKKWCENYNNIKNFNGISDRDMFDVLSSMNKVFGIPSISRKKYKSKLHKIK